MYIFLLKGTNLLSEQNTYNILTILVSIVLSFIAPTIPKIATHISSMLAATSNEGTEWKCSYKNWVNSTNNDWTAVATNKSSNEVIYNGN